MFGIKNYKNKKEELRVEQIKNQTRNVLIISELEELRYKISEIQCEFVNAEQRYFTYKEILDEKIKYTPSYLLSGLDRSKELYWELKDDYLLTKGEFENMKVELSRFIDRYSYELWECGYKEKIIRLKNLYNI